jgi:hypothetical protein
VSTIPQSTLQALLPVLSGIDPAKLTAQLKLLGQQDKATLDKMVFFLKAVSLYCCCVLLECSAGVVYCWCVVVV